MMTWVLLTKELTEKKKAQHFIEHERTNTQFIKD